MSVEMSATDVTLVIAERKFHYRKETLSYHSTYFQAMFFSNFAEKNKNKIEIKGVAPDDFMLFLDAIQGVNSVSDENVENALAMSAFLGSPELEKKCMYHLAQRSKIPLKEQFQLAELHDAENLMIQVCSSIKDAYELDEVVPKDLDSFCNRTKNIVLQRSFELHGIRKAPLPPQSEQSVIVFEDMMNEFLDQADIQNRHGMILADQAALVTSHIIHEEYLDRRATEAKPIIQQDLRMQELMEDLRNSHSPAERNAVRAQILVVKLKNLYTTLVAREQPQDHPWIESIPLSLEELYKIMFRNQQNHSKSNISVRGELPIDQMYQRIVQTVDARLPTEAFPQNEGSEPIWVKNISEKYKELLSRRAGLTQNISDHISETFRGVSEEARFQRLTGFVQVAREHFFMGWMRREEDNWNQNRAEENMQE